MFGEKPLFSRGQLSILMVVATLAIALLANLDGKPKVPQVQRLDLAGVAIYWSGAHDSRPHVLVNLALPEAVEPLVVGTVLRQLAARLGPEVDVRRHPDRWELLVPGPPAASGRSCLFHEPPSCVFRPSVCPSRTPSETRESRTA